MFNSDGSSEIGSLREGEIHVKLVPILDNCVNKLGSIIVGDTVHIRRANREGARVVLLNKHKELVKSTVFYTGQYDQASTSTEDSSVIVDAPFEADEQLPSIRITDCANSDVSVTPFRQMAKPTKPAPVKTSCAIFNVPKFSPYIKSQIPNCLRQLEDATDLVNRSVESTSDRKINGSVSTSTVTFKHRLDQDDGVGDELRIDHDSNVLNKSFENTTDRKDTRDQIRIEILKNEEDLSLMGSTNKIDCKNAQDQISNELLSKYQEDSSLKRSSDQIYRKKAWDRINNKLISRCQEDSSLTKSTDARDQINFEMTSISHNYSSLKGSPVRIDSDDPHYQLGVADKSHNLEHSTNINRSSIVVAQDQRYVEVKSHDLEFPVKVNKSLLTFDLSESYRLKLETKSENLGDTTNLNKSFNDAQDPTKVGMRSQNLESSVGFTEPLINQDLNNSQDHSMVEMKSLNHKVPTSFNEFLISTDLNRTPNQIDVELKSQNLEDSVELKKTSLIATDLNDPRDQISINLKSQYREDVSNIDKCSTVPDNENSLSSMNNEVRFNNHEDSVNFKESTLCVIDYDNSQDHHAMSRSLKYSILSESLMSTNNDNFQDSSCLMVKSNISEQSSNFDKSSISTVCKDQMTCVESLSLANNILNQCSLSTNNEYSQDSFVNRKLRSHDASIAIQSSVLTDCEESQGQIVEGEYESPDESVLNSSVLTDLEDSSKDLHDKEVIHNSEDRLTIDMECKTRDLVHRNQFLIDPNDCQDHEVRSSDCPNNKVVLSVNENLIGGNNSIGIIDPVKILPSDQIDSNTRCDAKTKSERYVSNDPDNRVEPFSNVNRDSAAIDPAISSDDRGLTDRSESLILKPEINVTGRYINSQFSDRTQIKDSKCFTDSDSSSVGVEVNNSYEDVLNLDMFKYRIQVRASDNISTQVLCPMKQLNSIVDVELSILERNLKSDVTMQSEEGLECVKFGDDKCSKTEIIYIEDSSNDSIYRSDTLRDSRSVCSEVKMYSPRKRMTAAKEDSESDLAGFESDEPRRDASETKRKYLSSFKEESPSVGANKRLKTIRTYRRAKRIKIEKRLKCKYPSKSIDLCDISINDSDDRHVLDVKHVYNFETLQCQSVLPSVSYNELIFDRTNVYKTDANYFVSVNKLISRFNDGKIEMSSSSKVRVSSDLFCESIAVNDEPTTQIVKKVRFNMSSGVGLVESCKQKVTKLTGILKNSNGAFSPKQESKQACGLFNSQQTKRRIVQRVKKVEKDSDVAGVRTMFVCHYCGKIIKFKINLSRHIQLSHFKELGRTKKFNKKKRKKKVETNQKKVKAKVREDNSKIKRINKKKLDQWQVESIVRGLCQSIIVGDDAPTESNASFREAETPAGGVSSDFRSDHRNAVRSEKRPMGLRRVRCDKCDDAAEYDESQLRLHLTQSHGRNRESRSMVCDKCCYPFDDLASHMIESHTECNWSLKPCDLFGYS